VLNASEGRFDFLTDPLSITDRAIDFHPDDPQFLQRVFIHACVRICFHFRLPQTIR
jgi:hypothetical protein